MRIILSRKGIDTKFGPGYSPIMPNGDMISFPIPRTGNESGIPYKDIYYDGQSYAELARELKTKFIRDHSHCHLDPDLRKECKKKRKAGWKGIFGQNGGAKTQLVSEGVTEGDVFLFSVVLSSCMRIQTEISNLKNNTPGMSYSDISRWEQW